MKAIWIELAARDIDRANQFYSAVFGHDVLEVLRDAVRAIVVIPGEPTVSLSHTAGFLPNGTGTLPYFHIDGPWATPWIGSLLPADRSPSRRLSGPVTDSSPSLSTRKATRSTFTR